MFEKENIHRFHTFQWGGGDSGRKCEILLEVVDPKFKRLKTLNLNWFN